MDNIIKEELWRSIGVFSFAFILTNLVVRNIFDHLNSFLIFWLPLALTFIIMLFFIFIRKKSFGGSLAVALVVSLLILNVGIFMKDVISIFIGLGFAVYGVWEAKRIRI